MNRLAIHIGLILTIMGIPGLSNAAAEYSVLDTTRDGRQLYREAVDECSVPGLIEVGSKLMSCHDTLVADAELGRAFEPFLSKTSWLTGWTYFRRYEVAPRGALLDSAAIWFARVVRTGDSSLAPAAAYMRGECGWRWIQNEVWEALCVSPGLLSADDLQRLLDHAELTAGRFDSCLALAAESSLLTDAAALRKADVAYLSSWLQRAAHHDSIATRKLDSSVIPSLEGVSTNITGRGTRLLPIVDYNRGWCDLALTLWPVAGPLPGLDLQDWAGMPGPFQVLRQGIAAQVNESYISAAEIFRRAGESDIAEGDYWGATAYLIAATSQQSLDQARLTTLDALRRSRQSYRTFLATSLEEGDYRLSQLASQCRRRLLLLQVATGEAVDFDSMRVLGREDLRFLVRIMVNTLEPQRSRALRNLSDYLQQLLRDPGEADDIPIAAGECRVGSAEPLTTDETEFYLGLTQTLYAQGTFGDRRAEAFRQAAATLAGVGGQYQVEAMYMRARALFSGREFDQAGPLLERLVTEHRSTRAAYWYAANFARGQDDLSAADTQHVRRVLRAVINSVDEAGTPSEYTSTRRNAEALLGRFDDDPGVAPSRELTGLEDLVCPESLSVDSAGPWPQRVFYETMYERELIERQFVQLGREELSLFGPRPRSLYPTAQTCGNEAEYFMLNPPPVSDHIEIDDKWTARVRLASGREGGLIGQVDSLTARNVTTGELLEHRWSSPEGQYYLQPKATIHDVIELTAFHGRHYPRVFTMTSDRAGGFKDTVVVLAERVVYTRFGEQDLADMQRGWIGPRGRNAVLSQFDHDLPAEVMEALSDRPALRDVSYDPTGQQWLGLSMEFGGNLMSFGGTPQSLPLSLTRPLSSPEGLAVLPDGRILIADWGNHRVAVLDRDGNQAGEFGILGHFMDSKLLGEGCLVFPTRIQVVHDPEGIEIEGRRYPGPTHILVADRYGIHRFDSDGRYLETALEADSADPGSWHDLRIDGYGAGSQLQVVDLRENRLIEFKAGQ